MKLFAAANRAGSTGLSNGTATAATATSVWNAARTAVAPFRFAETLPAKSTATTAASFVSNFVSQVTSRRVPSEYVAHAASGTASPTFNTRSPGVTSSFVTCGSVAYGPGAPAAIQ